MAPTDSELVRIMYGFFRGKACPRWDSLTVDEQKWWLDLVSAARKQAKDQAASRRTPLVGRFADPVEK